MASGRRSNKAWSAARTTSTPAPSYARHSSPRSNYADEDWLNTHEHNTTVMIQRLAPDQTEDDVRAALCRHGFGGAVDVVYVPMNRKRTSNLGYAFVNFTSTASTRKCLNALSGRSLGALTGDRPCRAAFSKMQGDGFLRHRAAAKAQEERRRPAEEAPARADEQAMTASASYAELAASMLSLSQPAEGALSGEAGGSDTQVVVLGEPVSL